MRTFLKGWRRKTGSILLVMALVFMGGWIRSTRLAEGAVIQLGTSTHVLSSANGNFSWMRHAGRFPTSDTITYMWWPVQQQTVVHPFIDAEIEWQRRFRWNGFDVGEGHLAGLSLVTWTIPYWSMAVPLTLLSACLILWKSRIAKDPTNFTADQHPDCDAI